MEWLLEQLKAYAMSAGLRLVAAVIVAIVGFKLVSLLVKKLKKKNALSKADPSAAGFVASFISIGLKIVVIISVIAILGVPMSSVVALVASAGVAIGLAVQGALSNLVGGIMILLFRPFSVGNYIEAEGAAGTVRAITVFYTILVTPDNKVVTVPNGTLTNSVVTNYSAEDVRRVDVNVTVDYDSDIESVKNTLLGVASTCDKILDEPSSPVAVMLDCTERGIQYSLRVWCNNSDYWDVRFALLEGVRNELKNADMDIPYPQMEVRIKNEK